MRRHSPKAGDGSAFYWLVPVAFCFLPEESVLALLLTLSDPSRGEPPLPRSHTGGLRADSVGLRVEAGSRARRMPSAWPRAPARPWASAASRLLTRPCFLDMRPGCLSLGCHSWTRSEPPHAAHSLTQSLTHCFPWKTPSEEKLPIPDTITHTPLMSSQQRRLPHGHGRSQGQGKSQCVSTHGLAHSAGSRKHVEPWQQLARQATKAFGG